jgi:perosamine synthetase
MAKYPWWTPQVGQLERTFISEVMDSNFLNDGEYTTRFERGLAEHLGCKHVVAVTSGTAALFLSLAATGVGPGDEVIVPDVTFIATANAVSLTGAKVVLVDVEPATLNIDIDSLKKAITSRTKAIMPVHVTGKPAKMSEILEIAKKHNLRIIEDAAEGLKSKYLGKCLGTIGDAGCLSFSPFKTITTGQGGAILTNDDKIYARLKELKDQGRPVRGTGGDDVHHSIGYNFKFTNLQAAVGLGQLSYLDTRIDRLKSNYEGYVRGLKDVKGISIMSFDLKEEIPQWIPAFVDRRDDLDQFLQSRGADCRRFWFPIHTQQPYRLSDEKFPNSTRYLPNALWLPSAFTMKNEDIQAVCGLIKEFLA